VQRPDLPHGEGAFCKVSPVSVHLVCTPVITWFEPTTGFDGMFWVSPTSSGDPELQLVLPPRVNRTAADAAILWECVFNLAFQFGKRHLVQTFKHKFA